MGIKKMKNGRKFNTVAIYYAEKLTTKKCSKFYFLLFLYATLKKIILK